MFDCITFRLSTSDDLLFSLLDQKRQAKGNFPTIWEHLVRSINHPCKFQVSKSGGNVKIVFTSLHYPHTEVTKVSDVSVVEDEQIFILFH